MANFKWTGDTSAFLTYGKIYEIDKVGKYSKFIDDTGGIHTWTTSSILKDGWVSVDASPSPIRTRREVVSGVYGVVRVDNSDGRILLDLWRANPTADQLREAAHLFNQIAEVLEENSK